MRWKLAALAGLLSACAHRPMDPVMIGPDTYMITAKGAGGVFQNGSDVKLTLYKDAIKFCGTLDKYMEEVSSTSQSAAPLRMPSAELHFRCVTQ